MFFHDHSRNHFSIKWHWPISIGMGWGDSELVSRLVEDPELKDLYRIRTIRQYVDFINEFNIVIYRSLEEAEQRLNRSQGIRMDIILIFSATPITYSPPEKKLIWDTIKYFQPEANGLVVFHTTDDLTIWLNKFLLYLARNKDIIESVEATASSGYSLFDRRRSKFLTYDEEPAPSREEKSVFVMEAPESHYKASPPPASAMAPPEIKDASRYLQAKIRSGEETSAPIRDFLLPGLTYRLDVRIGLSGSEYISAPAEFPSSQVFEKSRQKVETLQIVFITDNGQGLQTADLVLPREGNSPDIQFSFLTPVDRDVFTGEIYAYHKNRLIQKVVLTAYIKTTDEKEKPPVSMEVVFCARKELDTLSERTAFNTSIFYAPDNSSGSILHVMTGNSLVDLHFTTALADLVKGIRNDIEDAVIDIDHHPEDLHDKANVRLLRRLAIKGSALFVNHLNKNDFKGPLQIVADKAEFVPLDFVYALPPPDRDAGVCTGAVKALEAGTCMNCFHKGNWPASHICPFGFWSFSRVIERHSYGKKKMSTGGEYHLLSEPVSGRETLQILKDTIYAASNKIDASTPGLRLEVATAIHKCASRVVEATTWKEWRDLTQELSPDSMILLVHIERDAELDTDAMEIGDKQFLPREFLNQQQICSQKAPKTPMVIVIGCESADISNQGFDISSQFMNNGAAIVLSNFTKIRGRQAGPIVIKLVEFLKNNAGREMTLGEIVLKLKQYLLARGIIVGLSLVTHGDADWKIKI